MERWTMLCLLLSSMLLGISSCKTMQPVALTEVTPANMAAVNQRISTATYNTQIDFFGKHFSGLMVFKAISDTCKRAVFITQTGFKFFDFEFTPGTFAVKYCLPGLNKKLVINTLRRDLALLLNRHFNKLSVFDLRYSLLFRYPGVRGKYDYYVVDKESEQLKSIMHGNDIVKNVVISLDKEGKNIFDSIWIADHPAHLKIFMKQIDK